MIGDLNTLPDGIVLHADLCIVGAGAAGLLIARALAGCGLQIVLLESGGRSAQDDTRSLSEGEWEGQSFRGLTEGRARGFGGTTSLWGGQCIRLDPIDFERRAWVPGSGWPITAEGLQPFYQAAEAMLEITPQDMQIPAWQRFGLAPIAFDPSCLRPVHGVFIRRPHLGRRLRAEFGASETVHVVLHATAQRLSTNPYGTQISDVEIASLQGRRGRVKARRVVLCAGAIENARLLLLSDDTKRNGLGNENDLVGRYLQDHPCGVAADLLTDNPRPLQDHWNMLYGRFTRYLPKIALAETAQRNEHLLNCVGRIAYDYRAESATRALLDVVADIRRMRRPRPLARRLGHIGIGLPEIAGDIWRVAGKGLSPAPRPSRIKLEVLSEQTPDRDSRITLAPSKDAFGLRQVRVDWRLDALTGRTMAHFTHLVGREFARLGLGSLRTEPWLEAAVPPRLDVVDSFHPAGTTRMACWSDEGVVDTDCQVFGVHGLYVAGSAVFPTSGAANPTLTIAAMALRLAERLRRSYAEEASVRPTGSAPHLVVPVT